MTDVDINTLIHRDFVHMTTKSRSTFAERRNPDASKRVLADRLAELKGKDYTVERLAGELDAKVNTVRDWLKARVLPRAEALIVIAKRFDVTTDWLLGLSDERRRQPRGRPVAQLYKEIAFDIEHQLNVACPPARLGRLRGYRWEVGGEDFLTSSVARVLVHAARALRDEDQKLEAEEAYREVHQTIDREPALKRHRYLKTVVGRLAGMALPGDERKIPLLQAGVRLVSEDDTTTREELILRLFPITPTPEDEAIEDLEDQRGERLYTAAADRLKIRVLLNEPRAKRSRVVTSGLPTKTTTRRKRR
jgi:transcriptional regulator with XRE-family HTH domain